MSSRSADWRVSIALLAGLSLFGAVVARVYSGVVGDQYRSGVSASWRVDVNTAALPDLLLLPGIHQRLAKRILEERQRGGPFADASELGRRVEGIGEIIVGELQPFTTWSRPWPPAEDE